MAKSYYDTLGVHQRASETEIRQAYRRLARKHHPDLNPGDKDAEARFKEINEAYGVLSDTKKRQQYDHFGDGWGPADQFARGHGRPGARASSPEDMEGDPFFGIGPSRLDDILGQFMGGPASRRTTTNPNRRVMLEQSVEISLQEAFDGTTRVVQISGGPRGGSRRLEGTIPPGVESDSRIRVRPDGIGQEEELYLVVSVRPDPRFDRRGSDLYTSVEIPLMDAILGGEVKVPTLKETIALKIPPDTQNGGSFRLSGKGMPSLGSTQTRGSLYVTVQVNLPSQLSERERELFEELKAIRDKKG